MSKIGKKKVAAELKRVVSQDPSRSNKRVCELVMHEHDGGDVPHCIAGVVAYNLGASIGELIEADHNGTWDDLRDDGYSLTDRFTEKANDLIAAAQALADHPTRQYDEGTRPWGEVLEQLEDLGQI